MKCSQRKVSQCILALNYHQDGVILKDSCIILPKVYHKIVITLGQQVHQGIIKTEALLRGKRANSFST